MGQTKKNATKNVAPNKSLSPLRFILCSFAASQFAARESFWCNGTDTQGSVINIRYACSQKKPFSTLNDWLCDSMCTFSLLHTKTHTHTHLYFVSVFHPTQRARKLRIPHVFFCHLIFIWLWLSLHLHFHLILNTYSTAKSTHASRAAHKIMPKNWDREKEAHIHFECWSVKLDEKECFLWIQFCSQLYYADHIRILFYFVFFSLQSHYCSFPKEKLTLALTMFRTSTNQRTNSLTV